MFWRGHFFSERFFLTLSLFLIASLHTLIFSIFQIPENFLLGSTSRSLNVGCKIALYTFAVVVSAYHQVLCRKIGLRKTLYFGLLCNLLGMSTLFLNQLLNKGTLLLIFLDMIFFGLALTSVINSLVTYIVLEFPKKVGIAIVSLFAFLNLGVMLGPLLLDMFQNWQLGFYFFPFLIALLLLSLWFVHFYFFDPPFPPHLAHLHKGSLIWKELHYRLGLYIIAIIAYGLAESTFSLWGYVQVKHHLGLQLADETISFFWLFLIIGQICLLLPLYFFPARRIFYFLVLVIMGAGYYLSLQQNLTGFIAGLAAAGFGCSAVFPILLSMMEKEILSFSQSRHLLLYIEMVISLMIGGYFLGVGLNDIWVTLLGDHPILSLPLHVNLATYYIAATGLIALFLNCTLAKR